MTRRLRAALLVLAACGGPTYQPGDPCRGADVPICGADGRSAIVCPITGTWELRFCRGALGCQPTSDGVRCDNSQAQIGDLCGPANGLTTTTTLWTCSANPQEVLFCPSGDLVQRYVARTPCRPTDHCSVGECVP